MRFGYRPSWWRFPRTGSLGGEGGRFFLAVMDSHLMRRCVKRRKGSK